MKKLVRLVIPALLLVVSMGQGIAYAHEGHDVISSETALSIANKSVNQLTFKDLGYEIGKLDPTWKSLTMTDFSIEQILEEAFIVSATNTSNNMVIYFEIAKNGKVLSIKDSGK